MTTTDTPTFDATLATHPDAVAAMTRPRWSYAAALKAADEAIASQSREEARGQADGEEGCGAEGGVVMSVITPNIRPYKVGHESVLVVGVEGVVDKIDEDTLTINGITLPRRLDRDRGVRYLSMVWPDGDETTCDLDHCSEAHISTPLAEDLQDDLDRIERLVREEHDDHHGSDPLIFCSHAICREVATR